MPVIPNNVDWSATAAWIALIVSVLSPVITTYFTNKHQLKLRKMDITEKAMDAYEARRHETITTFLSNAGRVLSNPSGTNIQAFSQCFYSIYQYIPESSWEKYDEFYSLCISTRHAEAHKMLLAISHELNAILKEAPRSAPSK